MFSGLFFFLINCIIIVSRFLDLVRLISLTHCFRRAIIPPSWRDGGAEATETSGPLNELGDGRVGGMGRLLQGKWSLETMDSGCHRNCPYSLSRHRHFCLLSFPEIKQPFDKYTTWNSPTDLHCYLRSHIKPAESNIYLFFCWDSTYYTRIYILGACYKISS